jgi:parallel beta-helix repeat protein
VTDVSNLDNLAAAISTGSAKIRNYATAQAAATQSQEVDIQALLAGGGPSSSPNIDVRDYGALLDGTTDDSAAIQAAIDAAWDVGGGIVVIPGHGSQASNGGTANGKNVIINTTLNMRSGVWLRGLGSTTVLAGSANPMIQVKLVDHQDRMTISDMTLQPNGLGIKLAPTGLYQLGWPRITVMEVTVADAGSHAFWVTASGIETRFINCVSLRAIAGHGFFIDTADSMTIGCTAAEGVSASFDGFNIKGGNNKLGTCKAYGNEGNGFALQGSGRHVLSGCEAQDNGLHGFHIGSGGSNTLAACLADSDKIAGVRIDTNTNTVNGSFIYGGGGSGQVTRAGVLFGGIEFGQSPVGNIVTGVTNCPTPVGGKAEGNAVYMNTAPGSRKPVAFTTSWTPNPYDAEIQAMTLTGNLTLVNPIYKHIGQQLTLELRQDGTGTRTTTFPDQFRVNWTPDTTANRLNIIGFEYDGTAWQQTSAVTGLTAKPSIGKNDNFNRANEALNISSSGHTWEKFNQDGGATWQVVSNQVKTSGSGGFRTNIAVLDAATPDFTVEVKIIAQGDGPGLVWRYTNSTNFYFFVSGSLRKRVAGVDTTFIQSLPIANNDILSIRTSGPNHFYYRNGTLVATFTDDFNLSATKAGIYSSNDSDIMYDFAIV